MMGHCFHHTGRRLGIGGERPLNGTPRRMRGAGFAATLLRLSLALAVMPAILGSGFVSTAQAKPYLLGPEDKLKIKVYDWRPSSSEAHEWAALTGEFSVGASGNVSLPLIGEVPAAGRTTADLAAAISERLQANIGLSNRPDASVEVATYRPFFITGLVATPGQYPYKPDMTVLQAISTAGGIRRITDPGLLSFERDSLVSRGDLRTLGVEHVSLLAREARLNAELQDTATISFPAELTGPAKTPQADQVMREEQLLFDARRQAIVSQEESINQTKMLLLAEVDSLKAKSISLQRQLDLAKQELDNINGLVSKGLAVASRQLQLDQTVSQYESSRLDVDLAILRAQQDIGKAGRDILDLHNKRRNDILTEMSDVRAKLAANVERTNTTQALIYNSEVEAPQAAIAAYGNPNLKLLYSIVRSVDGQLQSIPARESDAVNPGDTITVDRLDTPSSSSTVSAQEPDAAVR